MVLRETYLDSFTNIRIYSMGTNMFLFLEIVGLTFGELMDFILLKMVHIISIVSWLLIQVRQ